MLVKDFNKIILPSKQQMGVQENLFKYYLNCCVLINVEYLGNKFTWQIQSVGDRLVSKKAI